MLKHITDLDRAFLRWLHRIEVTKGFLIGLQIFVRIGDGWIWAPVILYLYSLKTIADLKLIVIHCLLALAISLIQYWPIKLLVRRLRPFSSEEGILARVPPLDKYSFPSGHTMNNLTVGLTLSLYLPQVFYLCLLIPLLWGSLRVFLGVHYLSDILGGATLGIGSFFIAQEILPYFITLSFPAP